MEKYIIGKLYMIVYIGLSLTSINYNYKKYIQQPCKYKCGNNSIFKNNNNIFKYKNNISNGYIQND